jgi:glyoxylase I family protein
MPPVRMSHVGLAVADMDTMTRFYTEGLGFEVGPSFEAGDDVAGVSEVEPPVRSTSQYLTKDGFRLELIGWDLPGVHGEPSKQRNQRGLTHLALEVDDLAETEGRLLGLGGTTLPATRVVLDRDPAQISILVMTDPEGTRIELLQRHQAGSFGVSAEEPE